MTAPHPDGPRHARTTYRIFGDGYGYYEAWRRDGDAVSKVADSCDVVDMYRAILADAGLGGDEVVRDPIGDEDEPTDFGVIAEDFDTPSAARETPPC